MQDTQQELTHDPSKQQQLHSSCVPYLLGGHGVDQDLVRVPLFQEVQVQHDGCEGLSAACNINVQCNQCQMLAEELCY